MIRLSTFTLSVILLALSGCSSSIYTPENLLSKFEKKGHKMRLGAPYSGVMLIGKNDSIVLHQAYGYENWDDQTPNSIDNQFPIASITKQFTSMLVMIQVDQGVLNLDTAISTYLPELQNEKLRNVTLHHLLSHTSGLPHYEGMVSLGYNYSKFAKTSFTPSELVQIIDRVSLRFEAGENYYYSSLGYMLLGAILERTTELSYAELLERDITNPLDMTNTGFESNDYVKQNVVNGYAYKELYGMDWWKSEYGGQIYQTRFRDQSGKFSTGGIHSTALDLWKWSQAIRKRKLISKKSYDRMLTPNMDGFCYGWIRNWDDLVERNVEAKLISHSGALPGYRSTIALYDDGSTIISLSNIQPMKDRGLLHQVYLSLNGLSDDYQMQGYPEWPNTEKFEENGGFDALNNYFEKLSVICGYEVKPSASSLLRIGIKYLDSGDVGTADSVFNSTFNSYEIEANVVNNLGYKLLELDFCDQSKIFFTYNIENDSLSANAWDGLGDAYRACGDTKKAAEYYLKAVQLAEKVDDPNLELFRKKYDQTKQ